MDGPSAALGGPPAAPRPGCKKCRQTPIFTLTSFTPLFPTLPHSAPRGRVEGARLGFGTARVPLTLTLNLRARRPRSGGPSCNAQPMGNARRSHRHLAGLTRRAGTVWPRQVGGRITREEKSHWNFSRNARAMREPGGLERRPTTRARRRTHEDHTTLPRRRATPQTALPRRWPAGWAICPIRSKMHDVQAERARRRLPAPASPWRPPGLHVAATEGSPGA